MNAKPAHDATRARWSGFCDVLAIAISRDYDLPVWGAFERLRDGQLGFLCHAFCRLPDGRIVDCDGISAMISPEECSSGDDPDVVGFAIVPTGEHDPHLLSLARHDYDLEIERTGAREFIAEQLAPLLEAAGIPRRYAPRP
jgi:hypothetical protein